MFIFALEFAFLWTMNLVCTDEDFREIRREGSEMQAESVFQPLCWWDVFCLFGVFLSGFPKCVSLPLICMANMVVLLFMEQFLFFLWNMTPSNYVVMLQHKVRKEYRL